MHSSVRRVGSIATMLFLVLGFASTALATGYQGGVPWQVGDVIICFGNGTCNAVRIVGGVPKLLDQFSDGLGGDTRAVVTNNTLHAVVSDNGSGGQSNVVVYSIASVNPTGIPTATVAHTPVNTFNQFPNNAQAMVVTGAGHIFVGNAGSGASTPTIVELNPDGTLASVFPTGSLPTNPLPLTGCADIADQLLSMDLSKDGLSMYLTTSNTSYQSSTSNGGHIQKLTLSTGTCTPFASFGSGVALNGIQDLPPGALAGVSPSCKGTSCPSGETILVVAEGFFDSDGNPGSETGGIPDSGDDVNICTNTFGNLVSCALLLNTGGPGLIASPWLAGHQYLTAGVQVLDANLHVQQVATAGTSGTYGASPFHPAWSMTAGTIVDNAVTWTDQGISPCAVCGAWVANHAYLMGNSIVDSAHHLQKVTVAGTSGPSIPTFNHTLGTTIDGLTWTDQGTSVVATYQIASGLSTLQALTLDPLVRDCSGGSCSTTLPTVSNFWLGDSQSQNFYEVSFGSGGVTAFNTTGNDANADCSSHTGCTTFTKVQGLRIYGAEGANQANLTKLARGFLSSSNNFTASGSFPLPVVPADTNTMKVSVFNGPSSIPYNLYGSLISSAATSPNGNNSGKTDANSTPLPNIPCQPTTSDPDKCIVWKVDLPTDATLVLPPASVIATSFTAPAGKTDDGTHVFLDEHYDVTTFVGTFDPGGGLRLPSVWSLNEFPSAFQNAGSIPSGCFYLSPSPANACFKTNRGTLPFIFQCPGISQSQFVALQNGPPLLSIVQSSGSSSDANKPAPQPIQLTATNNKAPYRYDPNKNYYIFNWTTKDFPKANLEACTFDQTGTVQSFCVKFRMDPTCK